MPCLTKVLYGTCLGIEQITKEFLDPDIPDRMVEKFYSDSVDSASKVWLCHRKSDISCTMRFIPKPKGRNTPKTSSSAIRRSIEISAPCRSTESLPSPVLHAEILFGFLSSRMELSPYLEARRDT